MIGRILGIAMVGTVLAGTLAATVPVHPLLNRGEFADIDLPQIRHQALESQATLAAAQPNRNRPASHSARLSRDGLLVGRLNIVNPHTGSLIPATSVTIYFLQAGRVVRVVRPGPSGIFQARLLPGRYDMVAGGGDGFYAASVSLTASDAKAPDVTSPQIEAAVIGPVDFPGLRAALAEYLSHKDISPRVIGSLSNGRTLTIHYSPGGALQWYLVQGARVLRRGRATDGTITLKGLAPGGYSLVLAGRGGFASFGVVIRGTTDTDKTIIERRVTLIDPTSLAQALQIGDSHLPGGLSPKGIQAAHDSRALRNQAAAAAALSTSSASPSVGGASPGTGLGGASTMGGLIGYVLGNKASGDPDPDGDTWLARVGDAQR